MRLGALVVITLFLAGTFDPSLFAVLDADYALTNRGSSTAGSRSHRRRYA